MGLDMYAFTFEPAKLKDPTAQINLDFVREDGEERRTVTELAYWRKFNHLHGWMERLYEKKGGEGVFNCKTVRLTEEDLDQLEADWKAGKLTATEGFFFGSGEWYPEDDEAIAKFLMNARAQLAAGKGVFYDSWW